MLTLVEVAGVVAVGFPAGGMKVAECGIAIRAKKTTHPRNLGEPQESISKPRTAEYGGTSGMKGRKTLPKLYHFFTKNSFLAIYASAGVSWSGRRSGPARGVRWSARSSQFDA
jgi:hypothetical protein